MRASRAVLLLTVPVFIVACGGSSSSGAVPDDIVGVVATYVGTTGLTHPTGVPDYFLLSSPPECPGTGTPQFRTLGGSMVSSRGGRLRHGEVCIQADKSTIQEGTAEVSVVIVGTAFTWALSLDKQAGDWQVNAAQYTGF